MQINICITRDVNVVFSSTWLGTLERQVLYGFVALCQQLICVSIDVQFLSAESCYIAIRAGIIISISFLWEQPKMKLPLVKSALLPFLYMPWFWSFDFLSQAWLLVV
jgi:hypothetical protein